MTISGLTVAVCTHNRLGLLRRTLVSVRQAQRPYAVHMDVLVVANACGDGTEDWLAKEASRWNRWEGWSLRVVREPAVGKVHALNRIGTVETESLIIFVDDDHRVDPGCFQSLVEEAQRRSEGLFCGRILPDWDGREPAWVHDGGPYRLYPLPVPRFDLGPYPRVLGPDGPYPGGGNLAVRREVLERVGPFRAGFGPVGHNLGGAEDMEWVRRALAQGERIRYVPGMLQYHYVDPARFRLGYLLRKAYERSASVVRLEGGEAKGVLPPVHMWAKVLDRAARLAMHVANPAARRFYAMRLAGALGEIKGYRLRRKDARRPAFFQPSKGLPADPCRF